MVVKKFICLVLLFSISQTVAIETETKNTQGKKTTWWDHCKEAASSSKAIFYYKLIAACTLGTIIVTLAYSNPSQPESKDQEGIPEAPPMDDILPQSAGNSSKNHLPHAPTKQGHAPTRRNIITPSALADSKSSLAKTNGPAVKKRDEQKLFIQELMAKITPNSSTQTSSSTSQSNRDLIAAKLATMNPHLTSPLSSGDNDTQTQPKKIIITESVTDYDDDQQITISPISTSAVINQATAKSGQANIPRIQGNPSLETRNSPTSSSDAPPSLFIQTNSRPTPKAPSLESGASFRSIKDIWPPLGKKS